MIATQKTRLNYKKEEVLYKRMRIHIKLLYRNEFMCSLLSKYVLSIKGVKNSKANAITGKILVLFDEKVTNECIIESNIHNHLKNNKKIFEEVAASVEAINPNENIKIETNRGKLSYHSLNQDEVESILKTNYSTGLDNKSVQERINKYGFNVLSEKKKKSFIKTFLENLNDFSTKLLLGVAGISFLLGQIPEAIAIGGIVFIQTTLGTVQQHKAEASLYSLKDMMVHKSTVIRNGRKHKIETKKLIPGDIILVESGDKIPADARIIECSDLKTTEASLTGESTPVYKSNEICNEDTELANRHNMIYMGTNVLSGRAKAVVVDTGLNTEIGKIANMLQNIKVEPTPLQKKIEKFTNNLTKMCMGVFIGITGVGLLSGMGLGQVLTNGVSFSIGALPESLPVVLTAAMSLSVQRLGKRNAIVRKLTAVETLGSADVICCDKTGTLTMNEMTVKKMYVGKSLYKVSGSGYNPDGEIKLIEGEGKKSSLEKLLEASVLCNNANLIKIKDKWNVQGDPTEGALITVAHKINMDVDKLRDNNERIQEIPFDSERKYMSVVVDDSTEKYVYCKGAIDSILPKCNMIYENGKEKLFTYTDKEKVQSVCDEMAEDALRVLALAYKKVDDENSDIENNLVFLGFIGMEDPARMGVKKSIQKCFKLGVKVVMITGDCPKTGSAIGKQLGLLTDGLVVTGQELEEMTDEELDSKIGKIQVFARTSPVQKHRIVSAFKRANYVVAMTGDGVNDAPAIKEADIGIAMGNGGSDVAKDAADITLVDDDFSTIVRAIEEGRTVASNIRSSMKYLLSGCLGEILAIGLTSVVSGVSPLLPIQILWVNLISETLLGSALATQPPCQDMMNNPPVKKNKSLIDRELGGKILRRGLAIGFTTFAIFEGSLILGLGINKARTLALTNLVSTQLMNLYDCRNNKKHLPNKYMNMMALSSAAFLIGIVYLPFFNSFFSTMALRPVELAAVGATTALTRI